MSKLKTKGITFGNYRSVEEIKIDVLRIELRNIESDLTLKGCCKSHENDNG